MRGKPTHTAEIQDRQSVAIMYAYFARHVLGSRFPHAR